VRKYYMSCPDCRTRMRRTGKKVRETKSIEGNWIYEREYECPNCGKIWAYSEYRNLFTPGPL